MLFIRKQLTLLVIALFLTICSPNNLPTTKFAPNTNPPLLSPTQPPIATILPTETHASCPPFDIIREIPSPNIPESYIGRYYFSPEIKDKLKYHEGAIIWGSGDYGFERVTIAESLHMIWFTETYCRDNDGKPVKEILDVVFLPKFIENELIGIWYCSVDGIDDPEIIALGEAQCGDRYLNNIKQAWRLNRRTEKIESIPTENVICLLDLGECY